jgi:hypothetical protein
MASYNHFLLKTFALQMKIIRLACEQIPVPRVEEEIIGRGSNRITIAEEQLTSYLNGFL